MDDSWTTTYLYGSAKIPPLYSISSLVRPVKASRVLLSLFTPSTHLDFGLPWFRLPSSTALNRALCGRSYLLCTENYLSLIFRKINDFVDRFILDHKSVDFTFLVVNFTISYW
jgi:hypothetical protein